MYGMNMTPAQFNTLCTLRAMLDIPSTSISEVSLGTTMINRMGVGVYYLNVTFKSGYGNREFQIARDGTSAPSEKGYSSLTA